MINKKIILTVTVILVAIISGFLLGKKSSNSDLKQKVNELQILQDNKSVQTPETTINCRPGINNKANNYVIGYGSLMNKDSRTITVPDAKYAAPVLVSGFERLWASRGTKSGATYLLAVPNNNYLMNAVYYKSSTNGIISTDLRESSYCRVRVPRKDILPLGVRSLPKGNYWMYVKDFKDTEFPTKDFPILQTYVDTFMTGCLQTQEDFNLTEFGKLCFNTTYNWDVANWLYDRSQPRYARYSENTKPYRNKIDKIIKKIDINDY